MITKETRQTICEQIGVGNILSISGGRVYPTEKGICLPVACGYRVRVDYDEGSDTYTVRRIFIRSAVEFDHGTRDNVYCDEVGEVAYRAGMFRSWDKHEWMAA